jgi:general stress protein 26
MKSWVGTAASALVSGTVASLAMTAALALLAKKEGKGALQPVNSTSHWLHGEEAGSFRAMDMSHTAVGFGTHHLSAIFWAAIFERWLANQPQRTPLLMLRDAAAMSAIAAAVDYGITPKRATPGWEEVLSKSSIGVTYGAMALGLAAVAMLAQELRLNEQITGLTFDYEDRQMSDADRVWDLMASVHFCMFSTWTGTRLRSRPMSASLDRDENVIRFLTDVRQHKDDEVREYPQVCLAFSDPRYQKYVSISGQAHISNDREMIKNLWSLPAKAWWQSADDPNIRVITVMPEEAEWWDSPGTIVSYISMAAAALTGSRPAVGEHQRASI